MRQTNGLYDFRNSARSLEADDDLKELQEAAMQDIFREGPQGRMRRRVGSDGNLLRAGLKKGQSEADLKKKAEEDAELVKKVMETSSGDNEALARKVHERYDAAGVKQPCVELRFDNMSASNIVPAGSTEGLFTVGKDLKIKALTAVGTATFQKPPMQEVKILQNISGVFHPGHITLLLGPPGGGKSVLMKTLSGAPPVSITGDIAYNGHKQDEFNVTRTARYVDQVDLHNPSLTVRETLTFSAMCQGPGYHRSMLRLLEEKEKQLGIEPDPAVAELMSGLHQDNDPSSNVALTLQLLSLVNCADTIVGDGMIRGVSGGEKKRVTTGEIVVGPSKVLFMDEISTGLDSASTFTIVQSLRNLTHATDMTVVVALLQPEPQVYDLFDDITLLANGRIMYQGPRMNVEPHFASLGFECIGKKAVADFLQELVSKKDQPPIRVDRSKFEPQLDYVPAAAFAAAFKQTDMFRETRQILDTPYDKSRSHPGSLMKSKYGQPGWGMLKTLLWRERLMLTANKQGQLYRYLQMAFLAFAVSTIFIRSRSSNDEDFEGTNAAFSAIFFSIAYMQFLGLAECAETMQRLPVFYKQKFALFFPAWAYAIPFAIIRIPITLIEVTFWSIVVYWIVGLESNAGRFFTFWGTLVATQLYSSSLYRLIGSSVRSIVAGTSVAVIIMLFTMLASGFVLLRTQFPNWLEWTFWVSPLQYVLTGLANNEFNGESYRDSGTLQPGILESIDPDENIGLGEGFLIQRDVHQGKKFRWIAPLVLIGWFVVLNLANMAALTFLPPPPQPPPAPPPQEEEFELSQDRNGGDGTNGTAEPEQVAVSMPRDKSARAASAKSREGTSSKGLNLPFEPITLTFNDLHYYVPNPGGSGELELLKGIYGVFRPGVLTALMGASGAGKTTLMDVLADRKTAGRQTGKVMVNGFEKNVNSFARVMGYCEQFDTHSPGATVEEAIRTSAALRLSKDIPQDQREAFIKETLAIVELDGIAGEIVGMPGMYGLSGEQFKRLTIAVELVANPAIIFMDEPTSGLDARAAQIVMRVVRNIVNNNRTIVCTIHQPNAEIFLNFDELLLLKRGGWTIYYGPLGEESATLVEWFESVEGAKRLQRGYNPATYMLEASTASEEERLGVDFNKIWEERSKAGTVRMVEDAEKPQDGAKAIEFESDYAQGRLVQYKTLIVRYFKSYWRSPPYNTTRLVLAVVSAVLIGVYYWSRGDNYETTADVLAILGALFMCVMMLGFVNFQMIIPTFFMERPVMYRERAAKMYAVLPWVQAMQDVELPWIALQSMIFAIIAYFFIGFEHDAGKFFTFWLVLYLNCLNMAYLGMVMVCITPNLQMGVTMGATFLGMWFLFAGFLITRPYTPPWWRWFIFLCPTSWSIYAIAADQLGDKDEFMIDYVKDGQAFTNTIAFYLDDVYKFEHGFRWVAIALLAIFVLVMRFVVAIATKYLNFQKR